MKGPKQEVNVNFFQHTILSWFKKSGRNFPWRDEKDPFRILVAEIMLQRTRAAQVFPVYAEFVQRFPDVEALASASLKDIAAFMRKLGLFWRSTVIKETNAILSSATSKFRISMLSCSHI
jgi:A/G-specific adenine glycosylase